MNIYLTAIIKSKPEYLTEVTNVLNNMVFETRKEKACLQYDLHQSLEDKNTFIFYEIWENKTALDEHNKQAYIKEFIKLSEHKLLVPPEVFLMKKV